MNFNIIPQIILGLIGLSFLVFIHELGHFLVARLTGVRVNVFSIGFGKKLFKFKKGDTVYCISAIPFGGYVAMAGENPAQDEFETVEPDHFQSKPIRVRAAIAFGGPFINVVFAYLILTLLYIVGVQEPIKTSMIVGQVLEGSAGESAGVLSHDVIISVNNEKSPGWNRFREIMSINIDNPVPIEVKRDSVTLKLSVVPSEFEEFGIGSSGIIQSFKRVYAGATPLIGTPAATAGILEADQISEVNGVAITSAKELVEAVQVTQSTPLALTLIRIDEQGVATQNIVQVTPKKDTQSGAWRIGLSLSPLPQKTVVRSLFPAMGKAFKTSIEWIKMPFVFIKKLFQGALKTKALSGPVGIVQVLGSTWMLDFSMLLFLLALISMNLGIMNLLPLAITDGGMLLFFAIEAVRGKPLPRNVQAAIQQVAIIFFITLFAYILWQDVLKFPHLTVPK
ncbi:MAG: RIP metalloprotease RseP [Fibrobacterales bacterium]